MRNNILLAILLLTLGLNSFITAQVNDQAAVDGTTTDNNDDFDEFDEYDDEFDDAGLDAASADAQDNDAANDGAQTNDAVIDDAQDNDAVNDDAQVSDANADAQDNDAANADAQTNDANADAQDNDAVNDDAQTNDANADEFDDAGLDAASADENIEDDNENDSNDISEETTADPTVSPVNQDSTTPTANNNSNTDNNDNDDDDDTISLVQNNDSSAIVSVTVASETTTASSSQSEPDVKKGFGIKCFWFYDDNATFDLSTLENKDKEKADKTIKVSDDENYTYNFCNQTKDLCSDVPALFKYTDKTSCVVLAGGDPLKTKWDILMKSKVDGSETKEEINGVKLTLDKGQPCKSDANKNYQVTWNIACDEKAKQGELIFDEKKVNIVSENKCELTIDATSVHGCTLTNYYAVSAFIRANKFIFGIVFILVGAFLNFLGAKIISITLFITAFFATIVGIFLVVFGMFGATKISNAIMWVILACSVILGVCVAYLFYKIRKAFYCTLGGLTGYLIGLLLYNFFFRYINSNPVLVYWLVIVFSVILGVLFALFMEKHLLIIATAILGSVMMIKGFGFMFGGFPEEGQVIDFIKRKEYDQLKKLINAIVYIYMAGFFVSLGLGIYVQYKIYKPEDEEKTTDKDIETKFNSEV